MDESISSFVVSSFVIHRFCNFILIFLWWRSD